MSTNIPAGSPLAVKLFSVALFNEQFRMSTFKKNNMGAAPKQASAEAKAKGQTDPGYPFVQITDLAQGAGDKVSVDLFNVPKFKPTMGDKKLAGRLGQISANSMDMSIQQMRGGIETGGKMTQKRTVHNLRTYAKAQLAGWNARAGDQICQIHVSGARGYQDDDEWVIPLAADTEFTEILVNPVLPPTRNRRFFGGDATSVNNIDAADKASLALFDRIRAIIDDMALPPQPVKLRDDAGTPDPEGDEEPLYICYVSSRVWYQIETDTTTGISWRTFLQNAVNRMNNKGWRGHPLFNGQAGMWNGILIKKMRRAVRFPAASIVKEYDASNVSQDIAVGAVSVDRCFLLGAQALGCAYGATEGSGYYFSWHEELSDHDNIREISTSSMGGCSKIRFNGSDGQPTDFGVLTIDVAAPAIT